MEKINYELNYNDFEKRKIQKYEELKNHPIFLRYISQFPKEQQEILDNIFRIEKMIDNELQFENSEKCVYYETLDENFEFVYRPNKKLRIQNERRKFINNYRIFPVSDELLSIRTKQLMEEQDDEYKKTATLILQALKQNKGVYLHGKMGVGKTYLLHGFLNFLIEKDNINVVSVRSNDLIREFRLRKDYDEFTQLIQQLSTIPILYIDDLGSEIVDDFSRDEVLFTIFDERMRNHKPTIISSNLDLEALEAHFTEGKYQKFHADKALRVVERIKSSCEIIKMNGSNRRYQ